MLEAGEGDVAFIQGGVAAEGDPTTVSSLATVGYEPVWIFYRRELAPTGPLTSPRELAGLRIAIGETGSGTNPLARLLLEDYGITEEDATLLELPSTDALAALRAGEADAAFFVSNALSPLLRETINDRSLELMSLADAEAITRRHRFLTQLKLPRGTVNLLDGVPRVDINLVAPAVNVVVRNDLHPDILRLLAFASVELSSPGGFFSARNEFPNTLNTDLPVSKEGEAYLQRIKNGEFMLDRYLPFSLAALFDRYMLFVVPLLLIALPLLSRSPVLYQVYMRRKVNRWYKEVRSIEQRAESMGLTETRKAITELESIDALLGHELSVSNEYMPNVYSLRMHVDYVIRRLEEREEDLSADGADEGPETGPDSSGTP